MLIRIFIIAILIGGFIQAQNTNKGKNYRSIQDIANQAFDTSAQAQRVILVDGIFTGTLETDSLSAQMLRVLAENSKAAAKFDSLCQISIRQLTEESKDKKITDYSTGIKQDSLKWIALAIAHLDSLMQASQSSKTERDSIKGFWNSLLSAHSGGAGDEDTTTRGDSLNAPSGSYWDITLASDDSTIRVSFVGTYASGDNFPLKSGESFTWKHKSTTTYPKIHFKKESLYSGAVKVRYSKEGY